MSHERAGADGVALNVSALHHPGINNVNSLGDDLVISQYKFFLSFENTVSDGYVSEKVFIPLRLGVVPVYLGTPDIASLPSISEHGDPWYAPQSIHSQICRKTGRHARTGTVTHILKHKRHAGT